MNTERKLDLPPFRRFRRLRRAIRESGVTEEDLLESGRQVREELFRERYPDLAKKYGI